MGGFADSFEHGVEKPDAALFLAAGAAIRTEPAKTLVVSDHPVDAGRRTSAA